MERLKKIIVDLKEVYGAINFQSALVAFEKFKTRWNNKYSYAIKSRDKKWDYIIPLFNYPPELGKIMYTSHTKEAVHRAIKKFTKTKTTSLIDQPSSRIFSWLSINFRQNGHCQFVTLV